jgi:hypothetical protein
MRHRYSFKSPLFSLLLILLATVGRAQTPPNWQWAAQNTTAPTVFSTVAATTTDAAGNIYVTGLLDGPASFGAISLTQTRTSGYVAKLSPTGQWLWALNLPYGSRGKQLVVSPSGDLYIGGTYSFTVAFGSATLTNRGLQDVFVAQLSASGQWLGAARVGGPSYTDCAGLVLLGTDVYVTGNYTGAAAFDNLTTLSSTPATGGGYLAKLSAAWQWQWATNLEAYPSTGGHVLALSPTATELYVGLSLDRPLATFGSLTFNSSLSGTAVVRVAPATGAIVGAVQGGGSVCSALRFDSRGRVVITGTFAGTPGSQPSFGTISLPSSGSTTYNGNAYVACLDPATQNWVWARGFGSTDAIAPIDLASGRNGEVCVAGSFRGTLLGAAPLASPGLYNGLLLRYDGAGALLAADKTTGSGNASVAAVGVDATGQLYVGGAFNGSISFGATTLVSTNPNANVNTLFLAKTGLLLGTRGASATPTLALFPNPAQHTTTVLLPAGMPATGRELLLRNALGQLVRRLPVSSTATQLSVELRDLAPGVYAAQLRAGDQVVSNRLVVE